MTDSTLYIAVCTNRPLHVTFVHGLMNLLEEARQIFRHYLFTHYESSTLVRDRQTAVYDFLEKGFSHLLFLDDDILPPPKALHNLFSDAVPIVAGNYVMRMFPFLSMLEYFRDRGSTEPSPSPRLIPALQVPLGFTLIRRQVLLDLKPPHFISTPIMGEDVYFSMRARKAGYKLYFDKEVTCQHVGHAFFEVDDRYPSYISGLLHVNPQKRKLDDTLNKILELLNVNNGKATFKQVCSEMLKYGVTELELLYYIGILRINGKINYDGCNVELRVSE